MEAQRHRDQLRCGEVEAGEKGREQGAAAPTCEKGREKGSRASEKVRGALAGAGEEPSLGCRVRETARSVRARGERQDRGRELGSTGMRFGGRILVPPTNLGL